jgi:hypothetical protein
MLLTIALVENGRWAALASSLCLLVLTMCTQSLAKGGNIRSEDRYDPQHIENLPPEIRK